jgi:hypothetical protein
MKRNPSNLTVSED